MGFVPNAAYLGVRGRALRLLLQLPVPRDRRIRLHLLLLQLSDDLLEALALLLQGLALPEPRLHKRLRQRRLRRLPKSLHAVRVGAVASARGCADET